MFTSFVLLVLAVILLAIMWVLSSRFFIGIAQAFERFTIKFKNKDGI